MASPWRWLGLLALGLAWPAWAAPEAANPEDTSKALQALFAIANEPIPKSSTCFGVYGPGGPPKVRDFLAVQFAALGGGANTVAGKCSASRCEVSLRHAAGEDVSSADVRFELLWGRADLRTLQCVITP